MKTLEEIYKTLDYLDSLNLDPKYQNVIRLLRKRLYRLNLSEERSITNIFSFETFIEILPFIVHSLSFFKKNTINLPDKFKQDLIFKYIIDYDQIVSSHEDIFITHDDQLEKISIPG